MTEAEKLVEECARELWYLYTTSPAWEAAEERHQETWRRYARAAISVTLNAAARVADINAENARNNIPVVSGDVLIMAKESLRRSEHIAAQIRALLP